MNIRYRYKYRYRHRDVDIDQKLRFTPTVIRNVELRHPCNQCFELGVEKEDSIDGIQRLTFEEVETSSHFEEQIS